MPFFKVTLVFQRCFLTKSLVAYLNDDFKESVHDMSTGLKAKLVGEMQQSANWVMGRPGRGCLQERGAPAKCLQLWREQSVTCEPISEADIWP